MKIYKITSPNTDLVYVGKTSQTLQVRLWGHHSAANRYMVAGDHYCSSIKVLEHSDDVIELIEETDDCKREAYWIKELNACNQFKMTLDMSDPISVAKYRIEYREANKDAICEYKQKYKDANRDAIREREKKYREANKDAIRERSREKVACDNCGGIVSRYNMLRHKKTKKCINNPL